MLLNRVLTVAPGAPASHRGWGWEKVTEHAIRTLVARDGPLVAILWGRDAANLRPLLGSTPIIESRAPVAAVGEPRLLRIAAVLAGERPARAAGRRSRRLALPGRERRLTACWRRSTTGTAAGCLVTCAGCPRRSAEFAYTIRPVEDRDIPDIREIYNYYVTNSVVTFDEKKWTLAQWREKAGYLAKLDLPFLVAQSPSGQVLGYALVQPMSSKSAYRYSVENSIYLGHAAAGKGLGRALLEALIDACEQAGIREIVAVISDKGAEASVALHEKLGFVEVGRMGRVGFKFGRWLGTIYLQKHLKPRRKGLFRR